MLLHFALKCVITFRVKKIITFCVGKLLHFALITLLHFTLMLLHFALVLHFATIVITFCVSITFCGDYYILRRNGLLLMRFSTCTRIRKTNMPLIQRSLYLLSARSIFAIFFKFFFKN